MKLQVPGSKFQKAVATAARLLQCSAPLELEASADRRRRPLVIGSLELGASAAKRRLEPGASAAKRRRGFTFIEVMFAVMILGFGVIMVAVMIPVAIRQTKETRENNTGSASVESGFHSLESVWAGYDAAGHSQLLGGALPATNFASTSVNPLGPRTLVVTFPSWGWTLPWHDGNADADADGFSDAQETAAGTNPNDAASFPSPFLLWQTLGNRIDTMSSRAAWIPFYARQGSLPPFIALVGVQARNVDRLPATTYANLDANPLPITFQIDQRDPWTGTSGKGDFESALLSGAGGLGVERLEATIIRIEAAPDAAGDPVVSLAQLREAAVEGAAIVAVNARGQIRVLTLSKPRSDISEDHWELAPGGDVRVVSSGGGFVHEFEFDPSASDEEPVRAYLVGRMLKDPALPWDADNPYIGPTQVVQVLEGKMLR